MTAGARLKAGVIMAARESLSSTAGASIGRISGISSSPYVGAVAVFLAAATAFIVVRLSGGTPSPFNQLGYVPILMAAYLFGWRGGLAAGGLVAVLLGPAATILELTGSVEGPGAWLARGIFFVAAGGLSGLLINRFRHSNDTIEAREQELRAIIEGATDALLVADDDRCYVAANPAACQLLGLPLDELLGRRIDDFVPGSGPRAVEAAWAAFMEVGSQRGEIALLRADGREITVEFAVTARHAPGRHLSILRDITDRKMAEAKLQHLALFDSLTSLPNSTLLRDRLRLAVRQARQTGTDVGLVHLDVNGFKGMNEALGRPVGDRVLQVIADRLMAVAREGDSVARMGGDEFAVILGDPIDAEGAWQAASRMLLAVAQPMKAVDADNRTITLDASAGLAMYPSDADDETGLLRAADLALDGAKRHGVGLAVYTAQQDEQARSRWARLTELRVALNSNELVLHYQPVFRAADLELISVEALVRWQHPAAGLLGPKEFVPLAEGSGLINELAFWVLRNAVAQASRWVSVGSPLLTAVNLSPLNVRDAFVVEYIVTLFGESGLHPELLKIEITESAIMIADQRAMSTIKELRELGVRVAIDDFGTGYSSLGSLRSLPVDEIKLDRSFIAGMCAQAADRKIVGSIIELAHDLGLEVIAEGVEDRTTLILLQQLGCDSVQGYFTGRPVPAEDHLWTPALAGSPVVTPGPGASAVRTP